MIRSISGIVRALRLCAIVCVVLCPQGVHAQNVLPVSQPWQARFLVASDSWTPGPTGGQDPLFAAGSTPGNLVQADADLASGIQREGEHLDACVDLYYRAAIRAWHVLEGAAVPLATDPDYAAAWQIYQRSLARLIPAASRFARLDPRAHLIVKDAQGCRTVPIAYYGFAWKPRDFTQVFPASEFQGEDLKRHYRAPGLGISLVALRRTGVEEPFFRDSQPFAVTAVLRSPPPNSRSPNGNGGDSHKRASAAVLEFYNPYRFDTLRLGAVVVRLQRDLSAPFAFVAQETPRIYLQGFFDPGEADVRPKLLLIEPYQRGKIPVVFVHGLLSDPTTWLDAVNELRAIPDIDQRYQFWYFRYPTAGALLESAATLRERLLVARDTFDPAHEDGALARMVLIGHSMGGLVSRFEVTYSYDILWRHIARQPLEAVLTTPTMRQRLERDFFFDPSPLVSRVVFIGTPHRGASMANRLVGRFASSLARPFSTEEPQYRQLMDQNQDVFFGYLQRSPPTSIDLLEPSNPLLEALAQMPFDRRVRLHSIIGTGGGPLSEPGDGVVPVSSARLEGVCSELLVPARHTELHRDNATVAELTRILRDHAREAGK